MGLIELIVTVCALSLPSQCEDQHFSFLADMSLNQCVMNAPPYIAQWTNEHPKCHTVAVRLWRLQGENLIRHLRPEPTRSTRSPSSATASIWALVQPSGGRTTQNTTPLFAPSCLGAQTRAPPSGATTLLILSLGTGVHSPSTLTS